MQMNFDFHQNKNYKQKHPISANITRTWNCFEVNIEMADEKTTEFYIMLKFFVLFNVGVIVCGVTDEGDEYILNRS